MASQSPDINRWRAFALLTVAFFASVCHERERRVTPLGSVLALKSENVPVPALGNLLIAGAQRDVIHAPHVKARP
jgi:hypothetical protein